MTTIVTMNRCTPFEMTYRAQVVSDVTISASRAEPIDLASHMLVAANKIWFAASLPEQMHGIDWIAASQATVGGVARKPCFKSFAKLVALVRAVLYNISGQFYTIFLPPSHINKSFRLSLITINRILHL